MNVSDLTLDKIPPQNLDAEMALLGSMLLETDAIATAVEHVDADSFYKRAHQQIFTAVIALYSDGKPVDLVTLTDALKRHNLLDEIGGPAYLADLTNTVPTAANAAHYARIVKEKSLLRQLIRAATQIVTDGYEATGEADLVLDRAEHLIFEIAGKKIQSDVIPLKEIIKSSVETIDRLYQRHGLVTGIATGYEELDHMTSGLQPGDFIVVAGRPSMGKSAFACCLAEHAAVVDKIPTVIFSLEMSKEHLVQRLLCGHARINAHNVRSGIVSQADWPKLTSAAGKLSEAPLFVDDSSGTSALTLRAKARRLKARHNVGLLIVDYLQLMEDPRISDNRQQEISTISRHLKALARELQVALVAVSQLSRAPERRESFRPRLSDLRESGAIEQDADLVLMLFREDYYTPSEENQGVAEIIIAKQRNGPIGTVKLAFIKEYTRFENLERRHP